MYNAEVLSKFPVVQHFPFGSLFSWNQDPNAMPAPATVHTVSQPRSTSESAGGVISSRSASKEGTKAPWTSQPPSAAPWAQPMPTRGAMPPTRAPWANNRIVNDAQPSQRESTAPPTSINGPETSTRAPWARQS